MHVTGQIRCVYQIPTKRKTEEGEKEENTEIREHVIYK
jgi:hypothetical protein